MLKTLLFLTALAVSRGSEIRLTELSSQCPTVGEWYLPHESDCSKFYYCQNGEKFIQPRDCPAGTEFSTSLQVCVHPTLASCVLTGEVGAAEASAETTTEDSCEYLDNGCPADYSIHLLLPHETSCRKFYYCVNGELVQSSCGRGTVFNPATQTCGLPGSIDRVCIEEESSEEDSIAEDSQSSEEIERLPNGCPVDYNIITYLPHEYYCNKYYQCRFGQLVERRCAAGTHFNPEIQVCDFIASVGCTLAGGDASSSEEDEDVPEDVNVITPPSDLLPNGCPVDGSINWLVPHEDCSKFYYCVWGSLVESVCPGGLDFSIDLQRCESPLIAGCRCKNKECSGDDNVSSSEEDLPAGDAPSNPSSGENQDGGDDNNVSSNEQNEDAAIVPPSDLLDNGCPVDGSIDWLVSHEDCSKFYFCVWGSLVEASCPSGLHFSPTLQRCDYPEIAGCGNGENNPPAGNDNDSSSEEDLPAGDAPSNPDSGENQPGADDNNASSNEQNDDDAAIVPPSDLLDNGCPVDGSINWLVPHEDCSKFYYCVWGNLVEASCPSGLTFSPTLQRCDFPEVAGCGGGENNPPSGNSSEDAASGEGDDSSNGETQPGGDDNNVSSDEQNEDDAAIVPPSDVLDNGCPVDGSIYWLVPHEDCSKFYYCVWGNLVEAPCPAGLYFSFEYQRCEFPEIAGCGNGEQGSVPDANDNNSSNEDVAAGDAPSNPNSGEYNASSNEQNEDNSAIVPPSNLLENGCPVDGSIHWLVPHEDCSKFYYCVWGNLIEDSCPAGLHFSLEYQRCEFPEIAGCGGTEDAPAGGDDNDSSSDGDAPSNPDNGENQPGGGDSNDSNNEESDDATATVRPPSDLLDNGCPVDGNIHWLVPHEDCSKFYYCVWGNLVEDSCPPGLHFSSAYQRCEYPEIAGCGGNIPDGNDNASSSEEDPPAGDEGNDTDGGEESNGNRCEEECNILPWAHNDCDKYWTCNGKQTVLVVCSEGLHFNPSTGTCDFICNAGCVRTHVQTSASSDGVRIFFPWDKVDSTTIELLKQIRH